MSQDFETFTESGVEADFLRWLDSLGWEVYGRGDTWGSTVLDNEYDRSRDEPVYWNLLREKVIELNEEITEENIDKFMSSLKREFSFDNLMEANQNFHTVLMKGHKFPVEIESGVTEKRAIKLIDTDDFTNNSLIAANQFRIRNKKHSKRPDINLFVNGIPIVTMELKSSTSNKDYYDAIDDLHGYEDTVPRLFVPTLMNVAADHRDLRYGAIHATTRHYYPWNTPPYEEDITLKDTVKSLFNPETVQDILCNFVFYKKTSKAHLKFIPRYMQYYAAKMLMRRIQNGERKRGLIWHTQGSGKSLTMLYTAKNLINRSIVDNPQVLVLVDREKLETQMSNELSSIDFEQYDVAESGAHLEELLRSGKSTLILTTIQKFGKVRNDSQGNENTIVLTDEAHRFMEENLGSKLEAVLPDCMHFGFTGTPVRESKRDTFEHYGYDEEDFMDHYSMLQGIRDEFILPVFFDERTADFGDYDREAADKEFERHVQTLPEDEKSRVIQKSVSKKDIERHAPRVEEIAKNIHEHFKAVEKNGFKGMVIAPWREVAGMYGTFLQEMRDEDEVAVLISGAGESNEWTKPFETTPEEREKIVEDLHEKENPKIVVVRDMLLTGFDEPNLKTIYLDRKLDNHNLLQAIARTNRIQEGKNNGEIVDYRGVFKNIDKALDYSEEVQKTAAMDRDILFEGSEENDITGFKPLLDELISIFDGIEKKDSSETIQNALARLNKNPDKRKEFLTGMRKLENLYESIQPDPRMADKEITERYRWLTQIKLAFNADEISASTKRKRKEIREKTQEILEDHIDVQEIQENYGNYKLNEKHLANLERLEPGAKATKIANATKEHLMLRQGKNPEYHKLSERLDEVLERWQAEDISDEEAVEQFETIEQDALDVEEEAEEKGLTGYEHAFYKAFTEQYSKYVDDQEAQQMAEEIGGRFRQEVDTSFIGWEQNEAVRNEFATVLIDIIVNKFDKKEFYLQNKTSLLEDFWMYVVENTDDDGH